MPPLEYDAPPVCVAVPACGLLRHMLISFLTKSRLQIPFHIPTRHHTLSRTTKTTIENFHSLHRSKVSKFHGMRLYARLLKTLEKQQFPPYSILSDSRAFYLRRGKKIKKTLQVNFIEKKCFRLSAQVFLVYDPFCGVRWSVSRCVECDGVLCGAMTPLECDATWVCAAGNPLREGFWATIPQIQQSERMLVVVI